MSTEKALALVLRTTDWSESSRIATLWTRELGKVRALAKGGRRLRSNFESALDLLTLCSIVLLRKASGGLDLLTEARVERRFPRLRDDLAALYAAYIPLFADGGVFIPTTRESWKALKMFRNNQRLPPTSPPAMAAFQLTWVFGIIL